ncbi:MAG: gamma-glutamyltransferase [Alphaproteobacteria bacterium]
MRDFQQPGRSPVHGTNGMAATSHPLATLTAVAILGYGGNAVDAGIAAAAVLAVVEPQSTGVGGDAFALFVPGGTGEVVALNGSGRAPAAIDAEALQGRFGRHIPPDSPHAVTVPGCVAAWDRLRRDFGTMDMADLLQPAISYAEDGYPVAERIAFDWAENREKLLRDDTARRVFLDASGAPPAMGSLHRQPLLAGTLREIAAHGRAGFYEGRVAEDIVETLRARGGVHTLEDFGTAEAAYVSPIQTRYRGYDIFECPPNGQGVTALLMLNLLSRFDVSAMDPLGAERFHLEGELTRLAFEVRDAHIGDPETSDVPVDELLSPAFADRLLGGFDPDRAGAGGSGAPSAGDFPVHPETVYLTVVDEDRNALSFINSIFFSFGSGIVSPRSGVVLHNRGAGFVLEAGHPNGLAPGKRPLHTIIPAIAMKDGRAALSFGVMHGQYQPVGQVRVLSNILDYGLNVQAAIDQPRAFNFGGRYDLERGVGEATAGALAAKGHRITRAAVPWGGAQAIRIDWETGVLTGGSDPRKDGLALGH